jgi:hypothetical protein
VIAIIPERVIGMPRNTDRHRPESPIEKAKELESLPPSRQTAFFLSEIKPLQDEATRIADQELAMMKDAERKGVQWPSDIKAFMK